MRKFFILGLVSSLAACGGGGGGKKPDPVTPSSSPVSNSSSSLLSSFSSSIPLSSSLNSSSVSSLGNSAIGSSLSSFQGASSMGSLGNSSSSSTSSAVVVPIDTTPDSFSFPAVTGAALNANITSATITISGINTAAPISIANGEYSIDGGVFTSTAGTISNGQTVVVSLTTATTLGMMTQATLIVGGVAQTFSVTTELPDTTPDAFSFPAVTGAALNATISSTAVTISGINTAAPISITGGEYSIAGGTATSATGTVSNGQTVVVSLTSSVTPSTTTQATLTVGGVAQTFSVTTELPDTTPDAFSFPAVTGAALSTNVTSAAVTISGINIPTNISITGGQYSINGGVFTSAAGTVSNGQNVVIRLISAGAFDTEAHAAITIGGITKSFFVTTNNLMGGAIQGAPLNIAGVVTTFAGTPPSVDGVGIAAKFEYPSGSVSVGAYLYVADSANNKIRRIDKATGVVTTFAGSGGVGSADGTGTATSFSYPKGITSDGSYLYVADTYSDKIRKIEIATGVVTTIAGGSSVTGVDGTGATANFFRPEGITVLGNYLYVADTSNHKIRKIEIATGVVTTLAGFAGNSRPSGNVDGTGTAARFNSPSDITNDGTYLYVADTNNNKIRKIDIATGVVTTFAGNGTSGSTDGTGVAASIGYPVGVICDGLHLYVTASNQIRKIVIATGVVTTLAGRSSNGAADGIGIAASFKSPRGISTDSTYLYVADSSNNKIRRIEVATGVVTTLAGSSTVASADGTGAAASFDSPSGITTDGTHLYVADYGNHKIRKIEMATGVVTTLAGSGSYGSVDGTGATASFASPEGITTDGTHLYVADTGYNKIRKIAIATGVVTTLAGSGSIGSVDGTGSAASFYYPQGITTDGTHLYVADKYNRKIRKIVIATGVVTTLAGSGSSGGANGTGAAASFYNPADITTDGTYLYVADSGNHKIRKIVIATGVVTTLAGSGSNGSADGTGAAASFANPQGITTDGTHLYVADTGSNTIRKIEIATGVVTSLAGRGSIGSADGVGSAATFNSPGGITTNGFSLFVTDRSNNTIRKIE